MTGSALADRLEQRGLAPEEAEPKRLLFDLALAAFQQFAGGDPEHAWWVPGRLEVFGKHTDYAGGHTLVCAVPRGFALVARARADGRLRVRDARRREELTLDGIAGSPAAGNLSAAAGLTGWRNYVHVVTRRLARNFPGADLGADIVLASDLPSASGMSSSSALVTGVAAALARIADLPSRPEWQANVQGPSGEAGFYACIENGMTFGSLAGDAGVGTHGGSEDHVAIVCGRAGVASAWQFVPIRHVADVAVRANWTFVIAASGVAARKTGPAKDAYNRLSRAAGALLDLWQQAEGAAPSLHAALTSTAAAPDHLRTLVRQHAPAPEAARLESRLLHLGREDARVLDAVEAFRAVDARRLGALSEASQSDGEHLLANQVPETIALAAAARRLGAFAASSFGAGFGGSVWALTDVDGAAEFAARWIQDYRTHFPHRAAATVFAAQPGPPLSPLV